jgi:hypothetical protein
MTRPCHRIVVLLRLSLRRTVVVVVISIVVSVVSHHEVPVGEGG